MTDEAAISTFTPIFSTRSELDMSLSSLSDVGRLSKFKMAAIETGSGGRIVNSGNWTTSVSIDSVTDVSGMVANVGVAVGIWSQEQSVRLLLFPFPVSVAAILIVSSRLKSGNVCQCRQYHIQVGQGRKYRTWW